MAKKELNKVILKVCQKTQTSKELLQLFILSFELKAYLVWQYADKHFWILWKPAGKMFITFSVWAMNTYKCLLFLCVILHKITKLVVWSFARCSCTLFQLHIFYVKLRADSLLIYGIIFHTLWI